MRKWLAILRWVHEHPGRDYLVCCDHADPGLGTADRPVIHLSSCLAGRPVADLAELVVAGAKRIVLDPQSCSAIPLAAIQKVLPGLVAIGQVDSGVPGYLLDENQPPVPRRVLWLGRASEGLPVIEGTDQERLAVALRQLGIDSQGEAKAEFLEVSGCIACGVCTRSCRQGALRLVHDGPVSRLIFDPAACTGARGCVMFCPAKAIRSTRSMTLAELAANPSRTLAVTETVGCRTCRSRFPKADADPECRVCRVSPLHGG